MKYRELNSKGTRHYDINLWEDRKYKPYDYAKNGLLQHLLSNKIVYSKNAVLKAVLQYYEKSIVFVLKYIDELKNFKNYHAKNR